MTDRKLDALLKQIETNKNFKGQVYTADQVPPYNTVTSGITAIDYVLGLGGIPPVLIELFGPPSVGKTTLTYYMMKAVQDQGRYAAYVAIEAPFDAEWANRVAGVDPEKVVQIDGLDGFAAGAALHDCVTSGLVGIAVWDSVGATLDVKEMAEGNPRVGGQSLLMGHITSRVTGAAWKNDCSVVFINQLRSAMNPKNPAATQTPGGRALAHNCSIRLELKDATYKVDDKTAYQRTEAGDTLPIGRRVSVRARKNKAGGIEGRTAQFDFWFDPPEGKSIGVDETSAIIDLAFRAQLIERAGSYYRHPTFGQVQGKKGMAAYFHENPEGLAELREQVIEHSKKRGQALSANGATKND